MFLNAYVVLLFLVFNLPTICFFLTFEMVVAVWKFFAQTMDQSINFLTIPHTISQWWRQAACFTLYYWLLICLPPIIMWHIWKARNKAKFENVRIEYAEILKNIEAYVHDLYTANKLCLEKGKCSDTIIQTLDLKYIKHRRSAIFMVRWIPPWYSWAKLNMDGVSRGNPGNFLGV